MKVQIENLQGEIIRHEEMTLDELNFIKDREHYYTPLGEYGQCEMCNVWYDKKTECKSDYFRLMKCGFCSQECADDATDEADWSDRSDWVDNLDWDYGMNY